MSEALLLDTHALIWTIEGADLRADARRMIAEAAVAGELFVSAASAWELGVISSKPMLADVIGRNARLWFQNAVARTRARVIDLDADLLLDVSTLPEPLHRDPADRMLIATARARQLTLVTRDRAILDYAAAGHVRAILC